MRVVMVRHGLPWIQPIPFEDLLIGLETSAVKKGKTRKSRDWLLEIAKLP